MIVGFTDQWDSSIFTSDGNMENIADLTCDDILDRGIIWFVWLFSYVMDTDNHRHISLCVFLWKIFCQICWYSAIYVDSRLERIVSSARSWVKELNPRRRVSQHRPDAEGLISILKCLKANSYVLSLPGRILVELPRTSALKKRLMHFPCTGHFRKCACKAPGHQVH
jgi:hypothetical protein